MQHRTLPNAVARAAAILCAALVATLSACQAAAPPTPTTAADEAAIAATADETADAPRDLAATACAAGQLPTLTAGKLTIGTDNPAYSPYWLPRKGGNKPPWDTEFSGDPTTGTGFEGAVAWALAQRLGYAPEAIDWVAVKFDNSYAPGPKPFDLYLAQVSYTPERAQAADLSDGYYSLNQALVALADTPVAAAKTMGDLKPYRFGAQAGTTSYATIVDGIAPQQETRVYDSNDAAIQALSSKQIDGLVVDLPTAFYISTIQLEGSVIVGQFPPREGEQEHFSMVLAKDSPLTPCVNGALAAMKADGSLAAITQEWLADKADAPVIQP